MNLPRHFRRPLTALLTVWMTVIGLGVSVSHAHATGGMRHVHGRGWNLSSSPVLPLAGSNGRGETHRHLILLGVEFPDESTPDTVPADACVTEPAIGQSCDLPVPDDFGQTAVDPLPVRFTLRIPPVCSTESGPTRLDPSVTLSAFARRVLTGVLRS